MVCIYEVPSPSGDGMVNTYNIPNVVSINIDTELDDLTVKFHTAQGPIKQIKEKYSKILTLSINK